MPATRVRPEDSSTLIEELLQLSADIGTGGTVLFGELLLSYFLIGAIVTTILGLHTPYPFLSLEADPVLLIDSTIVGVFIVQTAGSLLLYHFYVGIDDESLSTVVLNFILLGFGAGLLQMTLPETWELLISFVL